VKAAARYLDSHGGLGKLHQQVVVKVCNTQFTPNGEIQCAQQAASDPRAIAVATDQGVTLAAVQFTDTLQKAGVPDVGADGPMVAPSGATNPINFPLWASSFGEAACAVMLPRAVNSTADGFASASVPAAISGIDQAATAAEKAGFTPIGPVTFPITTNDMSPFVTQLAQKNPKMVTITGSPQNVGSWLAASVRLGKRVPTCAPDLLVPNQFLVGLGAPASNFYVAAYIPDPTWKGYPLLAQFRQQAAAEAAAGDQAASLSVDNLSTAVLAGWLGAQAVFQAGAHVNGVITRAKFLKTLNHTTVTFGTGSGAVLPPIDFAKPNPNPKYARFFNTRTYLKRWDPATKAMAPVPSVQPVYGDKLLS
jgi:hypothetical protein